jgi:hypothetical protein
MRGIHLGGIDYVILASYYDGLKILGFDSDALGSVATSFGAFQGLAHAEKIAQGRFVARKR